MCLLITDPIPKIADDDIICYGVRLRNSDYYIVSPVNIGFIWNMGINEINLDFQILEISDGVLNDDDNHTAKAINASHIINGNAFHTFKTYEDANTILNSICGRLSRPLPSCMIVKNVIPKGTKYYSGINSLFTTPMGTPILMGSDGYASQSLNFTEILYEYTKNFDDYDKSAHNDNDIEI